MREGESAREIGTEGERECEWKEHDQNEEIEVRKEKRESRERN